MRFGFTTGSCAAAGAKAAAYMLLTGKIKKNIKITTPKGVDFNAQLVDIVRNEKWVSCAVIKDGGDDPDVTTGCHIVAKVSFCEDVYSEAVVRICGGEGVGIVTKPGLDQKVGEAAINSVPRLMIEKEVLQVCEVCDYRGGLNVVISVPEGCELAEKTFNPRLGIKNGISILGTSGIVEPMSSQALLDTIRIELNQKHEMGCKIAVVSPGNYGLDFIKNKFNFNLNATVKCSNFIGDSLQMAVDLGFEKYLLIGHIGKLIKLSGGIMNTHSKIADCRMELLVAAGLEVGVKTEILKKILSSISTEDGCKIIKEAGKELFDKTMQIIMNKILFYLNKKAENRIKIECMFFSNQLGLLAKSSGFEGFLEEARLQGD